MNMHQKHIAETASWLGNVTGSPVIIASDTGDAPGTVQLIAIVKCPDGKGTVAHLVKKLDLKGAT